MIGRGLFTAGPDLACILQAGGCPSCFLAAPLRSRDAGAPNFTENENDIDRIKLDLFGCVAVL